MFHLDDFIARCLEATRERDPRPAIQEALERAMSRPGELERALPPTRAEVVPLYTSEKLSVLKAVWAPGMSFRPHNHLMWAAIGIYGGQEDNVFYRRTPAGLVAAGERQLQTGEVALIGGEAIHAVRNPRQSFTGAIHVYGGDIVRRPGRSEWEEPTLREIPYDFERVRRTFEQAAS